MNKLDLEVFIEEFCRKWNTNPDNPPLDVPLIGGAAVIVRANRGTPTKDVDIAVEYEMAERIKKEMPKIIKGSKHLGPTDLYLDVVISAFVYLPTRWNDRAIVFKNENRVTFWELDSKDLILTKIKRFSSVDRKDIETIINATQTEIDVDELKRIYSKEQFPFEPDYEENFQPRLNSIVDFIEGRIRQID